MSSAWSRFAELGTRVDCNSYGVVPMPSDCQPHPDAVIIGDAAKGLEKLDLEVPEDWNPIADLGELGPYGAAAVSRALASETEKLGAARKYRTRLYVLMVSRAVMGCGDDWRAETPKIKPVLYNGKAKWWIRERRWIDTGASPEQNLGHWTTVEVSGVDEKRRPRPGAYRKFHLEPDPHLAIVARIEWQVWRSALDLLLEDIGPLASIDLQPSALSWQPWMDGEPTARVLPDLTAPAPSPMRLVVAAHPRRAAATRKRSLATAAS